MNIKQLLVLSFTLLFSISANATLYTGEVAEDAFVTLGGYDLAWASPCSDGVLESSCGAIDMSEQSGYGWNIMTSDLFSSLGISTSTFVVNYSSSNTQLFEGHNYAKASGWFTDYNHIDVGNPWSFVDVADNGSWYETITYRSNSVPEPSALALLGLGLAGIFFSRIKKKG